MSKKHVEEYYLRMLSDYTELKNVLDELQHNPVLEDNIPVYMSQLDEIKHKVELLEANYKRLSYVMFLLNQPNKKKKKAGYLRREHKKLEDIPEEHRKEYVEKENSKIIEDIKNIK